LLAGIGYLFRLRALAGQVMILLAALPTATSLIILARQLAAMAPLDGGYH